MPELDYQGGELPLFAQAVRWKKYWSRLVAPHLGRTVLEVGAGLGANTLSLVGEACARWVCLEPDATLRRSIEEKIAAGELPARCETFGGTVQDLPPAARFDTVLYLDVLEHIPDDRREVCDATARLEEGGRLVVLSPAHPCLYSPFDRAIGHCRRYTFRSLGALAGPGLRLVRRRYLDSAGMLLSFGNRILRRPMPTLGQILLWDRRVIPLSRVLDRLFAFRLGKSVLCVWEKIAP